MRQRMIQATSILVLMVLLLIAALNAPRHIEEEAKVTLEAENESNMLEPNYNEMSENSLMVLAYDGDAEACYHLGLRFDYGVSGTQQNFSSAFDWYRTADAYGHNKAASGLGYLYLNGCGVDKNLSIARQYFIRAVEKNDPQDYVGLGRVGLEEKVPDEQVQKDIYTNILAAKNKGVLDGKYYLGYLYEKGIGTKKRPKKAFTLYQKVSLSESEKLEDQYAIKAAACRLGILYIEGIGTEKNELAAKEQFEKAAENGYAMADYYLGILYEMGYGTGVDYNKAFEYFDKAAKQNYAPALNEIGCMYFNGKGVETNYSQAVYYQKLAAALGYEKAQVNLGYLYENGYGVEKDPDMALTYYRMAKETGYPGADEAETRVEMQLQ